MTKKAISFDRRRGPSTPVGLGVALLGTFLLVAAGGAAHAVSLEDAVRMAVDTNPDIGVVAKDRRAVDKELRQAKALYLPSLDARVAYGPEWTKEVAGNLPGRKGRLYRSEESLILSQNLFDGYAAASEVARQRSRVKSAALRVTETSESVGLDAVQSYLDVVRQQELLTLALDNQGRHEQTLNDMKQRLSGGTGSMADVRQAESRLARAIASVAQTKGNLEDSKANYIKTVGETPSGLARPQGVASLLPPTVDMAVAQSEELNPRIAVANADVGTAQAELRGSAADFYPKFDVEVSAARDRNVSGVKGHSLSYMALVVMKWNLYRGGETLAKNDEFVERLAEAREVVDQAKIRAEEETRLSWSALQSSRDRREALAIQVKANEKVRDAYVQQFNLGQRSLLDVLDIENELFVSRGDLVTAEYVELFAGYRLLAVQGRMLAALGVNHRPEASPAMAAATSEEPNEMDAATTETAPVATETAPAATDGATPAAQGEEQAPAAETPAAATEEGAPAGEPAAAADAESAPSIEPAAGPAVESAQAPTQGFKDAAGEVSDESLMSLNFNPVWSVQ